MMSSPCEGPSVHCNGFSVSDQRTMFAEDEMQPLKTSKWWTAAAYNVTAIIGVGVLGLPHAMVFLTWGPGVVVLVLAFFITFFTMKQLIQLHEFEYQNKSVRYETYHTLGERAFPKWGFWIVSILQMVVEFSLDILYTVAAGEAANRIYNEASTSQPIHIFVWFCVFAALQIGLSPWLTDFDKLKILVYIASVMSVCYSTISWVTILSKCNDKGVHYRLPRYLTVDHNARTPNLELSHMDLVFRISNSIGVVAFAYAAHNVVLEIQNGMPSTPQKPSRKRMMRAVYLTYAVVALCYFPIAITVYQNRGNQISQNILSFMQYHVEAPTAVVITVNGMLIVHLVGSYQVFAQPVFKFFEDLFKVNYSSPFKRFFIKFGYIVLSLICAMGFPHFSPLLGFFGGFAIAPTTYILPCIIWLKLKAPRKWSKDWTLNWICIILGSTLMIVASVGGLRLLIQESHISDSWKLWGAEWKTSLLYSTNNITKGDSTCKK